MRTGRRELIRDLNRALVLNLLREEGPLSRAELARRAGLSSSTVTEIVAQLIADAFLVEEGIATGSPSGSTATGATTGAGGTAGGSGQATLGRPATLLRVDPAAGFVVGLKLSADSLTAAVLDLAAEPRGVVTLPHPPEADEAAIGRSFEAAIDQALRAAGIRREDLLGLGIGVPGAVAENGHVVGSPLTTWTGVDLAGLLGRRLNLPVFLDNDVNTLTVAEQLYGAGVGCTNFLVVTVGRGIGMGIVVNGTLHRGRHGAAGELGHVRAVPDGATCWCGRRGCLEAIAAEPALVREVLAATGRVVAPQDLAALAAREPGVAAILVNGGKLVGRAIGDAAALLDPERIVVSGEGVRLGAIYLDAIIDGIRAHHGLEGVEVVVEPWGDEAWARGAATLVLRELFHPAHLRDEEPPPAARPDLEIGATGGPRRLARAGRGGTR